MAEQWPPKTTMPLKAPYHALASIAPCAARLQAARQKRKRKKRSQQAYFQAICYPNKRVWIKIQWPYKVQAVTVIQTPLIAAFKNRLCIFALHLHSAQIPNPRSFSLGKQCIPTAVFYMCAKINMQDMIFT